MVSAAEPATEKALGELYCALQSAAVSGLRSVKRHFFNLKISSTEVKVT